MPFYTQPLHAFLSLAGPTRPTNEAIQRKLEDIFSRSEFAPPDQDSWQAQLIRLMVSFFRWLGSLYDGSPLLFWTLFVSCLLLLGLLLAHIIWTVRRVLRAGSRRFGQEEGREQRERLSQTYLAEAGRRADRGDFTEAIRFLFLSIVYKLDESGRVNFQRSYTNREYLALFEDNPTLHEQLRLFVDLLDEHWYGQHPTNQEQYLGCLALLHQIVPAD